MSLFQRLIQLPLTDAFAIAKIGGPCEGRITARTLVDLMEAKVGRAEQPPAYLKAVDTFIGLISSDEPYRQIGGTEIQKALEQTARLLELSPEGAYRLSIDLSLPQAAVQNTESFRKEVAEWGFEVHTKLHNLIETAIIAASRMQLEPSELLNTRARSIEIRTKFARIGGKELDVEDPFGEIARLVKSLSGLGNEILAVTNFLQRATPRTGAEFKRAICEIQSIVEQEINPQLEEARSRYSKLLSHYQPTPTTENIELYTLALRLNSILPLQIKRDMAILRIEPELVENRSVLWRQASKVKSTVRQLASEFGVSPTQGRHPFLQRFSTDASIPFFNLDQLSPNGACAALVFNRGYFIDFALATPFGRLECCQGVVNSEATAKELIEKAREILGLTPSSNRPAAQCLLDQALGLNYSIYQVTTPEYLTSTAPPSWRESLSQIHSSVLKILWRRALPLKERWSIGATHRQLEAKPISLD